MEDDPGLQSQLRWSFEDYEVGLATDRESAIAQLRRMEPSVVTLDLGLPPDPGGVSEGFATLEEILRLTPDTKVIVVTDKLQEICSSLARLIPRDFPVLGDRGVDLDAFSFATL